MRAGEVPSRDTFRGLVASPNVVLIEFMSGRCGTCREFSKEWTIIAGALSKKIRVARFDIDTKAGMREARASGVLQEEGGVPAVRLYTTPSADDGAALVHGAVVKAAEVIARVEELLRGLKKDGHGLALKQADDAAPKTTAATTAVATTTPTTTTTTTTTATTTTKVTTAASSDVATVTVPTPTAVDARDDDVVAGSRPPSAVDESNQQQELGQPQALRILAGDGQVKATSAPPPSFPAPQAPPEAAAATTMNKDPLDGLDLITGVMLPVYGVGAVALCLMFALLRRGGLGRLTGASRRE